MLGIISGYYSVIGTFYVFLFGKVVFFTPKLNSLYPQLACLFVHLFRKCFLGADQFNPFGFVHNGCCVFGRLKEKTKVSLLPIVREENNDSLEQRVKNLEVSKSFLECYA